MTQQLGLFGGSALPYRANGRKSKAELNATIRSYCANNRAKLRARGKLYHAKNREKLRAKCQRFRDGWREAFMKELGGRCVCCAETYKPVLSFDHINGDGAQHRRKYGKGSKVSRLPLGELRRAHKSGEHPLQVLCANCNVAKGTSDACPCPYGKKRRGEVE